MWWWVAAIATASAGAGEGWVGAMFGEFGERAPGTRQAPVDSRPWFRHADYPETAGQQQRGDQSASSRSSWPFRRRVQ